MFSILLQEKVNQKFEQNICHANVNVDWMEKIYFRSMAK